MNAFEISQNNFNFLYLLSASVTYFIVAIVEKIPIKPYADSLILAGIQAFLSVKSCLVFLYFGFKYGKLLEDEVGLITAEEQNEDTATALDDEETAQSQASLHVEKFIYLLQREPINSIIRPPFTQ